MKKLIILTESRRKYEVMCGIMLASEDGRRVSCWQDDGQDNPIVASFSNVASAYWEESAKEVED